MLFFLEPPKNTEFQRRYGEFGHLFETTGRMVVRFELKAEGRKNVERVRAKSKLGEKKTGQTLYCLVSCDVKEPQNNHFQEYVIFFAHNAFIWRFRTNTCFRDPSYTFLHEQINTDYLEMSEQW